MKVNADLYVKDVPGQLVGSLDPISLVDGNIVGVVHNREEVMDGRISVNITFEVDSAEQLDKLKGIWRSKDIIISRIGSVTETFPMEYMLIGDISASSIERMLNNAKKKVAVESMDIRYSSKTASNKQTIMISAKVCSRDDIKKLDRFLAAECSRSSIVYIRGVEE